MHKKWKKRNRDETGKKMKLVFFSEKKKRSNDLLQTERSYYLSKLYRQKQNMFDSNNQRPMKGL